jgi:hypothetical protein
MDALMGSIAQRIGAQMGRDGQSAGWKPDARAAATDSPIHWWARGVRVT